MLVSVRFVVAVSVALATACATGSPSTVGDARPARLQDIDGNAYEVVAIGSQLWMAESLRVTRAADGQSLASFAPNDDGANIAAYGRLYGWESARRACPTGWHLPSDAEWSVLESAVGDAAAQRLRDPAAWVMTTTATDKAIVALVPFGARPAGYKNDEGFENFFGTRAVFWTATPHDQHLVWSRVLSSDALRRAPQHPQYGFSVRCVADRPR